MGELALQVMDATMGDQQSGGDERRFEGDRQHWLDSQKQTQKTEEENSPASKVQGSTLLKRSCGNVTGLVAQMRLPGAMKWVDGEAMSFEN